MFKNMFEKALKIEKGREWSIPNKKTVDKDAIGPINVMFFLIQQSSTLP